MKRLPVTLPDNIQRYLEETAAARGKSEAQIIRDAVTDTDDYRRWEEKNENQ